MYVGQLTDHFSTDKAGDERKQFLFIQDFFIISIKMNCVNYITREKAWQGLTSMQRLPNGKRAEKCVKLLTSVHL